MRSELPPFKHWQLPARLNAGLRRSGLLPFHHFDSWPCGVRRQGVVRRVVRNRPEMSHVSREQATACGFLPEAGLAPENSTRTSG